MINTPALFSSLLKRLRAARDLTQEALAERVGCSVETIRAFETGRRRPSRAMAERLADVVKVPSSQRDEFIQLARSSVTSAEAPDAPPPSLQQHTVERAPQRRLPPLSTALIGRAAEQAELRQRLSDSNSRLLTLVGPGGSGKTRLALQVGSDLNEQFADGVVFVNLTSVASPDLVPAAIADTLGFVFSGAQPPEMALEAALRDLQILIIVDNVEHLLEAAPLLASIVRSAPGVRLLATSRERLRVNGEQVFALEGLALPADEANRSAVERSDAVLLFLTRARQVMGDFALTPANRAAVVRICRLLGGMPLGIELAASWLRVLSPEEIAVELARDLDVLSLSDRDADPRHRSMRAVFDHSWRLLDSDEQRVLARLSIFAGGCTREAAADVAGATLPVLAALIDKSLLRRTATGRYELHELVRQYAAQQLVEMGEDATLRARHTSYYANWFYKRDDLLKSPQQQLAVKEIMTEIDNLRAAWWYSLEHAMIEEMLLFADKGSFLWLYELQSWYQDAQALCRQTIAILRQHPMTRLQELILANHLGTLGWYVFRSGDPLKGLQLLEESCDILRPGDHPSFLFFSLEQITYLLALNGDFERANALVNEAQEVAQQIEDKWVQSHARFIRAVPFIEHDPEQAYSSLREGLPQMRAAGDRNILCMALNSLGDVALSLARLQEAEQAFKEALERSAEVDNAVGEVAALSGLALVACGRDAWRDGVSSGLAALYRARTIGDLLSQAKALTTLGTAEAGAGDGLAARRTFREAITAALAVYALPIAIDAWVGLAALDAADATRHADMPTVLASVQAHPATRRGTAIRAKALCDAILAKGDNGGQPKTQATGEDVRRLIEHYVEQYPT